MIRLASRLFLFVAVFVLASCEEEMIGLAEGTTSSLTVNVYIDSDGDGALSEGDVPVDGATVELVGPIELSAQVSDGTAQFSGLQPGTYQLSLGGANPEGATLVTATNPVVVAPFQGAELTTEFRYSFFPGQIEGRVFRDDDDDGAFSGAADLPAAGITIRLLPSATAGPEEALATTTTDAEGSYTFGTLRPGSYFVQIVPLETMTIEGETVRGAEVGPDATLQTDFIFEGTLIIDVADARDAPDGQTVTVQATITWAPGYDDAVIFFQDGTGGMSVFDFNLPDGLAIGDRIEITGTKGAFRGEVQLSPVLTIEVLGNVGPPAPIPVTADEIDSGDFAGRLVSADGVVQSVDVLDFGNQLVTLEDGDGNVFTVFADSRTGVEADAWEVGATFGVTGVIGTDDRNVPIHRIEVRSPDDVQRGGATVDIATARGNIGSTVVVEGIVTWQTQWDDRVFFFQDGTAGISAFFSGAPELPRGSRIRVRGEVSTFGGETQISPDEVEILATEPVPAPRGVTGTQINDGLFQGELVTVTGEIQTVEIVNSFGTQAVTIRDGAGTDFTVFADNRTGTVEGDWTVGALVRVTGVLGTDDDETPPSRLELREPSDIQPATAGILSVAEARGMFGETVTVEAIVTRQTPWDERVYFLQDATGGISTFHSGAPVLTPGDRIRLTGEVGAFGGEIQFSPVDDLTVLENVAVPAPVMATAAQINAGDFQGQLAVLSGEVLTVEVVNSFGTQVVTVEDAAGTTTEVFVDNRSGVAEGDWTVGNQVTIVGVLGTDDGQDQATRLEVLLASDVDFGS